MKLYKHTQGILLEHESNFYEIATMAWDELINQDDLYDFLLGQMSSFSQVGDITVLNNYETQAPIGSQEIWAAGVTYLRSKTARMEESKESGGATFYDKVYDAERPELFFKGTASRAVGTNGYVRIRSDSSWNVPEPELTLVITSSGKIVGYSIGNDMSSRSIEGENPLYLPQAKVYDKCAGLGPCVLVANDPISLDTDIGIVIERDGKNVYEGQTTILQMKRSLQELVHFLFRDNTFAVGVYLMTGTCLVPGNEFTLVHGDVIRISIDQIGTLVNIVE